MPLLAREMQRSQLSITGLGPGAGLDDRVAHRPGQATGGAEAHTLRWIMLWERDWSFDLGQGPPH